ncbi:hypothetical protein DFH27DRAFT_527500 [Peziza echinospora]|nr:hypothetical protein DFH27DRAFT_527500 [Peziza echinospora]
MPENDSDTEMLNATQAHPSLLPPPPPPPPQQHNNNHSRSTSTNRRFVPPPAPSPGAARGRHSSDEGDYDDEEEEEDEEDLPVLERPLVLLPRRRRRVRRQQQQQQRRKGTHKSGSRSRSRNGDDYEDGDDDDDDDGDEEEDGDRPGGVKLEVEVDGSEEDSDCDDEQEELNETFDFLALLCDILRLPDETLTTAYLYIHRYLRWYRLTYPPSTSSHNHHHNPPPRSPQFTLDLPTLSLASLSLSTKSTESPRRLRDILLPAHRILHPTSPPLTYPSHHYDALRTTLVRTELILLRALAFNIYLPLAYLYLPRILEKTLATEGRRRYGETEDWREYTLDEAEECGVVKVEETGCGRGSRWWVLRASRWIGGRGGFSGRTIAVAAVWLICPGFNNYKRRQSCMTLKRPKSARKKI